jgi:hypothetical protein
MPESEFEDCLSLDCYKDSVMQIFGVDLGTAAFRGKAKWSDRVKATFMAQGKPWSAGVLANVKGAVASSAVTHAPISLSEHKRSAVDALVRALEAMLAP